MAAANESQGLKIAVAAFIALTVILTVTSYFLYSGLFVGRRQADSRPTKNCNKQEQGRRAWRSTSTTKCEARSAPRPQEYDPAKEEIAAHFKKIDERLDAMINAVNAAVQKAQAEGAQGTELEEAKQNVQKIIASLRSEPNKTYISSLDRITELMENLSLLTTELSLNYVNLRKSLESATSVAKTAGRRSDQGRRRQPGRRAGRTEEARRRAWHPGHQGRRASDRQRQASHRDRQL